VPLSACTGALAPKDWPKHEKRYGICGWMCAHAQSRSYLTRPTSTLSLIWAGHGRAALCAAVDTVQYAGGDPSCRVRRPPAASCTRNAGLSSRTSSTPATAASSCRSGTHACSPMKRSSEAPSPLILPATSSVSFRHCTNCELTDANPYSPGLLGSPAHFSQRSGLLHALRWNNAQDAASATTVYAPGMGSRELPLRPRSLPSRSSASPH
jgi:hypothetical protein